MTSTRALLGLVLAGLVAVPEVLAVPGEPLPGFEGVQQAFLQERFGETVQLAQGFILEHPGVEQVPQVWLWMVLSLDRLQQAGEALHELDRLKSRVPLRDPLWEELLYWEGDISRRSLRMVRARAAFQRLVERHPDSSWAVQARLGLGLVELHQQNFAEAIKAFAQVTAQEADAASARDARLFEAVCHLQMHAYQQAIDVLTPLIKEFPEPGNIAQAAFYLGECYNGLGAYQQAAEAYAQAAAIPEAPRWAQPSLFGRGWAAYKLDRYEEAVEAFERYLAGPSGEHRMEAMLAEGSCLLKLSREREALMVFETMLGQAPNDPLAIEAGVVVADLYRRQGRTAKAVQLLNALLDRPLTPVARGQIQLRLGSLSLDEGNTAKATALYRMAAATDDVAIRQGAFSGLGDVKMFLGDLPAARAAYEDAQRLAPATQAAAYAGYQLGRLHLQAGAAAEAANAFRSVTAFAEGPLRVDAHLALALAYLGQGEDLLAREVLDGMRAQSRTDRTAAARAAYYLALMAAGEGNDRLARTLCDEVLDRAPAAEEAIDARLLIADLITRGQSVDEARYWLQRQYASGGLSDRQRARLAKRLGDLARGEAAYTEAVSWYSETAALLSSMRGEAAYRIASCYEESGQIDRAIEWYGRITQSPWDVRGRMAQAKLLERQERYEDAAAMYRDLAGEEVPEAAVAAERLVALQEEITRQAIRRSQEAAQAR